MKEKYIISKFAKYNIGNQRFYVLCSGKVSNSSRQPGSGNTKNIGSVTNIDKLINGRGIFAELGEDVFDDYWMYYLTGDMAKAVDSKPPYKNIREYKEYKGIK
jgi:hypothetical protein